MKPLEGKVAVVAGATRGAGRGIACMLGEAGAVVYCSGRSSRSHSGGPSRTAGKGGDSAFQLASRPETIEETAERVTSFGGLGIPVVADHTSEEAVKSLFERVRVEYGRLDVLVNDVWGGDELAEWGKPFWEQDLHKGWQMQERAVYSHAVTSHYAAPLLIEGRQGLIVEVTDGDTHDYRGNFFYDLAKASVIRMAFAMAQELRPHNVTALAITPGFLRSEAMLDYFEVSEANWRDGAKKDPHFIASESPYFVGRAVAALAADPLVAEKSGKALSSWTLGREYGFTDLDGSRPDWGLYYEEHIKGKS